MSQQKKKRSFRVYTYRGVELDNLVNMKMDKFAELLDSRGRRKLNRGLSRRHTSLIKRLRKAKKGVKPGDNAPVIRTHLRDMIILPEMVGSTIAVHNGKNFIPIEINARMIGCYLGEFSLTYKKTTHGRPGVGATHSSKFVPLK
ncbi:40S ribosomal protein S15 [Anaeramoeba flamelloides]|uniref:40S ribosomal protein S15 n=1 Tax=Anaeramoeba flamelloides TaxID=1746091 RepID=A0AAV7Y6M9_9EUKA|nr:40S ribosomal protein S15 [Anaeramoeba flamelloides]KAJ6236701.1 40S ribosomal protein S15 [Anaeramoeba flamelloides]